MTLVSILKLFGVCQCMNCGGYASIVDCHNHTDISYH